MEGSNGAIATEIQPKKIKGFGFGDIFKDKPIKLRPRSMEIELDTSTIDKVKPLFPIYSTNLHIVTEFNVFCERIGHCNLL